MFNLKLSEKLKNADRFSSTPGFKHLPFSNVNFSYSIVITGNLFSLKNLHDLLNDRFLLILLNSLK